jgi:hypothetical protein
MPMQIWDSNLTGVIIGVAASLISVYFAEKLRNKREDKNTRIKIYQEIKAITKQIYRYCILELQMELLHNYHKKLEEITNDPHHEKEAGRRMLQSEDFKLKFLTLEAEFERAIALYLCNVGNDKEFEKLVLEYDQWDNPPVTSFGNMNEQDDFDLSPKN